MRIVHISYTIPKPTCTDPEIWLRRINFSIGVLESMAKFADIIGIYHIDYKGVLKRNGVTYHFTGYPRWKLLFPLQFNSYIKNLSPDVVFVHGLIFPWQVIMLKYVLGKSVVIVVQHHAERPLRDVRKVFQMWADRFIKAYFFSSLDLGQQWVAKGQIKDKSKIKEVMEASSHFHPLDKEEARSFTKVEDCDVYLWVGSLEANKNPILIASTFIQFAKTNSRVKLYMIFQSVELLDELKSLITMHNVSGSICLVGQVNHDELLFWYNSADYIISSSYYEGSGIAVCEGMSCGCIPILTNIPSFRMMTADGSVGFLYEPGNEEALLVTLQKSLGIDRENERSKVLNQFKNELSFDAIASKTMQVLNEVTNQSNN